MPKAEHLRKPAEFQLVYKNGKRFDGRFMSAFILPNNLPVHRLGITASRKAVGNAVERNRAKRLLREAFRLSKIELSGLPLRYDFVINARRNLLTVKMQEPLADFRKIIAQIKLFEESSQQKAVGANLTAE
ncbi:MAG: ribonuclease P protein component [Pyrinomonadaceae bacterium]